MKICHVVISVADTHQDEAARQTTRLAELDTAVSAFIQNLGAHVQTDPVMLIT